MDKSSLTNKELACFLYFENYRDPNKYYRAFFYSPETIRSRIQYLVAKIQQSGILITIDTKVFKGIKLIGTEVQKRVLLEKFFSLIKIKKEIYKPFVVNEFQMWLLPDTIEDIFKIVDDINIKQNLNLDFEMYKKLTTQLIIIIHQVNNNNLVIIDDEELTNLKGFKEFYVAIAIQSQLLNYVSLSSEEIIFLANYLIALHLDLAETISKDKDTKVVKKIDKILTQIEQNYNIPFYSKRKFYKRISNHIYRIIYPISHNLLIYNPFVKEAKSEYFYSFSIASNIAQQIDKDFSVKIQESEIAYLAYHVQLIIDSLDRKKIKAIILYSRNYERTKLISSKISTYFDEIEIRSIDKYSPEYEFNSSYVYIGINLPIRPSTETNVLTIQNGFQSHDIKKIKFFIESQMSVINAATIHWIDENTSEEIIKRLLSLNNQEYFYNFIINREKVSSTSVGNLVAIPHPYLEKRKYKEQVIIGINKKAIKWGAELVQLIIIYIPSVDMERNEYCFSEFYQKTKSLENVNKMIKASSKNEFISIWDQI